MELLRIRRNFEKRVIESYMQKLYMENISEKRLTSQFEFVGSIRYDLKEGIADGQKANW